MRSILLFIILLSTLLSCGMRRQSVKQIISYQYKRNWDTKINYVSNIEVFIQKREPNWRDDMSFNKTLYLSNDSVLYKLNLDYGPTSSIGNKFLFLNYTNYSRINEESIDVGQSNYNNSTNVMSELDFRKVRRTEVPITSEIKTGYYSDSLEYYRTIQIPNEFTDEYRKFAYKSADSLTYSEFIPMSEMKKNAKLVSSYYRRFACISKVKNLYRRIWTDSSYVNDDLKVKKQTQDYFYIDKINESGLQIVIKYPLSKQNYTERHYKKDKDFPVYQLLYNLDTVSRDTTYRLEMKSSEVKKGILYTFKIIDHLQKEKDSTDLRIPITRRRIEVLTDKYGNMIKFHSVAYTNQGNKLEYAYYLKPYSKEPYLKRTLINKTTIPEISGKKFYDLKNSFDYNNSWGWSSNTKLTKKEIQRREARNEAKKRPKRTLDAHIRKTTKSLEKNRKDNFEKRISKDGMKVYHIWYFEN